MACLVTGFVHALGKVFDLSCNLNRLLNLVLEHCYMANKENKVMLCRQFCCKGYLGDVMYAEAENFPWDHRSKEVG